MPTQVRIIVVASPDGIVIESTKNSMKNIIINRAKKKVTIR